MKEKVHIKRLENVAYITINRPEKRNAMDMESMDLLEKKLDEIENNQADKVVAITGAGNEAFCSGGDLSVFHHLRTKEEAHAMLQKMSQVLFRLFLFPKPTVALLNGTAVGGGCEIASACDIRVSAPHAKFGFVQGKLAITTGWGGTSMLLERIEPAKALEIVMTARMYSAKEGKNLGFISSLIEGDFKKESERYLSSYVNLNSDVLAAYKARFTDRIDREKLQQRIEREIDDCSTLWAKDAHHDAVDKFIRK
ncbi:enoyl-CoA hydratase/isomerase family protein [Thalassorhabdus alkalitolerans]|uniref:Ethylmalonyl-CoA decarboxylase n=1 Tax=Thalassorhabdus alkalitolerans TaxID=2282697 RepID=A0ABW0YIV1_9BACI|nr:enoyl-CoA hydratase/isomerase family protein [Thalassobacillus sp. C254]